MSEILSTDSVAPEHRLAYWIDMICKTYVQLECDAGARDHFSGEIRSHHLPGLGLSVIRSTAQHVARTPLEIARSADDYFCLLYTSDAADE